MLAPKSVKVKDFQLYTCPQCNREFAGEYGVWNKRCLQRHLSSGACPVLKLSPDATLQILKTGPFKCFNGGCGREFTRNDNLKTHRKNAEHPENHDIPNPFEDDRTSPDISSRPTSSNSSQASQRTERAARAPTGNVAAALAHRLLAAEQVSRRDSPMNEGACQAQLSSSARRLSPGTTPLSEGSSIAQYQAQHRVTPRSVSHPARRSSIFSNHGPASITSLGSRATRGTIKDQPSHEDSLWPPGCGPDLTQKKLIRLIGPEYTSAQLFSSFSAGKTPLPCIRNEVNTGAADRRGTKLRIRRALNDRGAIDEEYRPQNRMIR